MFSHVPVATCVKEPPCLVILLEAENIKLLINWYVFTFKNHTLKTKKNINVKYISLF